MNIDIDKFIKIESVKHGMSRAEVARKMGVAPQALAHKIKAGTLRVSDLDTMANAMGCKLDIQFIDYK